MMKPTAGLLFAILTPYAAAQAGTININGQVLGPRSPKMVVDGMADAAVRRTTAAAERPVEAGPQVRQASIKVAATGGSGSTADPAQKQAGMPYVIPEAFGLVQKVRKYGELYYYVNGQAIDANFYALLTRKKREVGFDLGKIGERGRPETIGMFELIWESFRSHHALDETGRFVVKSDGETADHILAKREFAHHVTENKAEVALNYIEPCPACNAPRSGKTVRDTRRPCEDCASAGCFVVECRFELSFSGALPERPSLEELEKQRLLGGTSKVAKILAATPANLTQDEIVKAMKARAEAGESQSQYEIAMLYAPFNPADAARWLHEAAMQNHRMAQFHLSVLYETGRGVKQNPYDAMRWRRSSAMLGCRQSQLQMGRIYLDQSNGSLRYADLIEKKNGCRDEAYAWFCLGSPELPVRKNPRTPEPAEFERNEPTLNLKDYEAERTAQFACAREMQLLAESYPYNGTPINSAIGKAAELAKLSDSFRSNNPAK